MGEVVGGRRVLAHEQPRRNDDEPQHRHDARDPTHEVCRRAGSAVALEVTHGVRSEEQEAGHDEEERDTDVEPREEAGEAAHERIAALEADVGRQDGECPDEAQAVERAEARAVRCGRCRRARCRRCGGHEAAAGAGKPTWASPMQKFTPGAIPLTVIRSPAETKETQTSPRPLVKGTETVSSPSDTLATVDWSAR